MGGVSRARGPDLPRDAPAGEGARRLVRGGAGAEARTIAEAHYYCGIVYQRWSDDNRAYDHYDGRARTGSPESGRVPPGLRGVAGGPRSARAGDPPAQLQASDYFEHNAAVRHLLGQIAMLQDDPKTAAEMYSEAWRLRPEDDGMLEGLARAQYDAKMYGECFRSVTAAGGPPRRRPARAEALEGAMPGGARTAGRSEKPLHRAHDDRSDRHRRCGSSWVPSRGRSATTTAWPCAAPGRRRWRRTASRATCSRAINERHHENLAERPCSCSQAAERAVDGAIFRTWSWAACSSRARRCPRTRSTPTRGALGRSTPTNEYAKALWSRRSLGRSRILLAHAAVDGSSGE